MEAPPGFEPGVKVLQTSALPLGYGAMVASLGIEPRTRGFSVLCSTDWAMKPLFVERNCVPSKPHREKKRGMCSLLDQALDRLVWVSWMHCCTYTSHLSTSCSSRGLTSLRYGKSYLRVGFTLRCFQRLSFPNLATQPCHWRDNWCTRGWSIPVLSY